MASNLPTMQIAKRVRSLPQALSIYMNQLVYSLNRRGYDITTLSLGEAFFDIPLFDFAELDVKKGYHYSDSQGIPELRKKIAEFYALHYGAPVDLDAEILISAGSKPIIFMAMQATLNPDDEVLIVEPAWLSYQEQARLVGACPRFIPYDCAVSDFHKHYTRGTKMLVINNPNNPAGRLYGREELNDIYAECRARGIHILVDESYSDFAADGQFVSMAQIVPDKDGVIIVNSLSKNMGISGWRIGYAIAHHSVIRELLKINQHLLTCAPTVLLQYVARYFDQIAAITLPQVRAVVEKRERVAAMLNRVGLERLPGSSTFYFFVSAGDYPESSLELALHLLLNYNLAVVPGSAYGASTERFIRISIGTESEERIEQALRLLKEELSYPSYVKEQVDQKLAELGFSRFAETERG